MKQRIRKCEKVWLALFLTLAIIAQSFTGISFGTKAASTGYTELNFSHWGTSEGKVGDVNAYSLTNPDIITDLDGVAISGTINLNGLSWGNSFVTFGGTETSKGSGFQLVSTGGSWTMRSYGIGSNTGWTTLSCTKLNVDVNLRITFDKADDGTTWTVGVYADGTSVGTITYSGVTPGTYIGFAPNVTADMTGGYKEMRFGDWGTSEGASGGVNVYSLTNKEAISSLDGVAISGTINFNGQSWANSFITFGGTAATKHGGFQLVSTGGTWMIRTNGINSSTAWTTLSCAVVNADALLRITFDHIDGQNTWLVNIYADGTSVGAVKYSGATPGLYFGFAPNVTVDMATEYKEMTFADWGTDAGTSDAYDIYSLTDTTAITSLAGAAITGKVNYNGDTGAILRIGGKETLKHAGFSLMTQSSSGRLILWAQGLGNDSANNVVMEAADWAELIDTEFTLRLAFKEDAATSVWSIEVSINGELVKTLTYASVVPGLYIANKGVTVEGLVKEEPQPYTEMTFADWGVDAGTSDVYDIYSLTDTTAITSLAGVAITGKVNYNGDTGAILRIGGKETLKHAGFSLMTQSSSGRLILWAQGLGNDSANNVVMEAADWAELIDTEFTLRLAFKEDTTTSVWSIEVSVNGELVKTLTYASVTPGLYIANKGVAVEGLKKEEPQPYTEMIFGNWGVSEGSLHTFDIYSLTNPDAISDLDHVAISGKVCFAGNTGAYLRIGGTASARHTGISLTTKSEDGSFVLWPQGIGGNTSQQVIMGTTDWATQINSEFLLRMEFDKDATAIWTVKVYMDGTLKGTYNCDTIAPGLYIANKGVTVEGLGEIAFEDLNIPDICDPPTEMGGETLVGKYITSTETSGNTTVISAADTDNGYSTTADYSQYGLDYVMDFDVDRELKVLQLTDTQIIDSTQSRTADRLHSWEIEPWAPEEMYNNLFRYIIKTVREAQPDLILITGDVVYGEFDDNGTALTALINCMDSLQIPWAPIFGNHDNESHMGVRWQCEQFENSPYCLFNRNNEIGGNGNYSIGLAKKGTLERVIFMMDNNGCANSSVYNGNEVKTTFGFTDEQKEWYENTATNINEAAGTTIPSFLCYHAATSEVWDAVQAAGYQTAETDTYTIGTDVEKADEGDSGTKGNTKTYEYVESGLLDIMKAVGTDGAFFGHEHLNNISVLYEGIRWTYGLKTGTYDTHPDELGGTLITLAADSDAFTVAQVKTAKADMDSLYLRWDYILPEAQENPNYIFWDKGVANTGYTVPETATNATINDVACNAGDVHKTIGDWIMKYTENGLAMIKRLVVYIKGDANCDDFVGSKDLIRMKAQTKEVDATVPDFVGTKASDINGDGEITKEDIEALRTIILTME